MTVAELIERYRSGRATCTFDEALPAVGNVSRATFYRAAAAGEVPGVLKLGRKRLLSIPVLLEWLGVPTDDLRGDL